MKKQAVLFLLLLSQCGTMMAQQGAEKTLSNSQIKGIFFDAIDLRQLVVTENGQTKCYFDVGKKCGLKSQEHRELYKNKYIKGVGLVVFDENLDIIEEEITLFKPYVESHIKTYAVVDGSTVDSPTIASSATMISAETVTEKYPDLVPPVEEKAILPMEYYKNKIITNTNWQKTDKLEVNRFYKDSPEEEAYSVDVSVFDLGLNQEGQDEEFWVPYGSVYTDRVNGNTFAVQGKVLGKKVKTKKTNKTLMTFNKNGEVINRINMDSEVGQKIGKIKMFYEKIDGRSRIAGGVYILENARKSAKKQKKKGPAPPSPHFKDLYEFDENGKLVEHINFEAVGPDYMYCLEYWKSGDQHRLLTESKKPITFGYYASGDGKMTEKMTLTLSSDAFKGSNYAENWFNVYKKKIQDIFTLENGQELILIDFNGQIKMPWDETMASGKGNKGYFILLLDKDGTVLGNQAIVRDMQAVSDKAVSSDLIWLGMNGMVAEWLMIDEIPSGKGQQMVFRATLVTTDLTKHTTERTVLLDNQTALDWMEKDGAWYFVGKSEKGEAPGVVEFVVKKW